MTIPDTAFNPKEYYFENLLHMGFVGEIKPNEYKIIHVNKLLKNLLNKNNTLPPESLSLYEKLKRSNYSLDTLLSLIISEKDVLREYHQIIAEIFHSPIDEQSIKQKKWRNFEIVKRNKTFALKSVKPEGILTRFSPFGKYKNDAAIYVDLYSVSQLSNQEIKGFQGLISIVNERRSFYIKQKRESELKVFHTFLVDMRHRGPAMIERILTYENNLTNETRKTLTHIKEYFSRTINKATNSLELFSKYELATKSWTIS